MNVNMEHFISFEFSGNITFIICCLPFSWIVEWMRCIIVEQPCKSCKRWTVLCKVSVPIIAKKSFAPNTCKTKKAKSTLTLSFFRPYLLYCFNLCIHHIYLLYFNSREIQINLIESLQGLQEYKIAFEGSQNAFYKWLHCNIFGLQNWGGALNIISHQFHQIISSSEKRRENVFRSNKFSGKKISSIILLLDLTSRQH